MTDMVSTILASMVAHDPSTLPLASLYKATENSHPAAVTMMTAWRTIVYAGEPSLMAIDTTNCTAYFALDVDEGNALNETILRGRFAVVNEEITEIELFINRYRGDHGFSFSASELPGNYAPVMNPPSNRTVATRADLMYISTGLFAEANSTVNVDNNCRFTELGWTVVDTGTYANGTTDPVQCGWPVAHPTDDNARVGLVVDEVLGLVVTSGVVPGKVYGYQNVSAFIPDKFPPAQAAQETWLASVQGQYPVMQTLAATGDTLEVLQYYNGALQAMQINVYLSGPNATSAWLS